MLRLLLPALALLLSVCGPLPCGRAAASESPQKLIIGTMRAPPFVLRNDAGQWSGLSIELWNQIAAELKTPFEFREFDYDLVGLLDAVEQRKIDAAIAAIPVTLEGEARFDFSHPYFAAGLGIAVRTEPQTGILGALSGSLNYKIFVTIAALMGLLLLMGTLLWLLERKQQQQFYDRRPLQGIGDGVWWAAVTMTTTGYGDKVPVGWMGRSLAIVWMFASIFCIALFSATITSSIVVDRLKTGIAGPDDLPKARVAAVAGTAGEQWLDTQGLTARKYPFVIQASKALQRGDVEALIYEKAILGYMIKEYGWPGLEVLPHTLAVRDYAIALPSDNPIKEAVNRALLKVVHRPDWKDVVQRYAGATDQVALSDKR